ncbi:MAG: methyltransferase domain-containing protein [Luteimonas sp.]
MSRQQSADIARAFSPQGSFGNRYDHYYARAKLASDPLFPGALAALRGSQAALLDIGCGLGLLAHALRADGQSIAYHGIDIDAGKIARAERAAAKASLAHARFGAIDLTRGLPMHRGSIAILDVLQYLDADAQQALLDAAIAMLVPGARLVLRAALADSGRRGRATRITDWLGHLSGWMQTTPKHYPHRDALRAHFAAAGLQAQFAPLHGNTPFNHTLIVVERKHAVATP